MTLARQYVDELNAMMRKSRESDYPELRVHVRVTGRRRHGALTSTPDGIVIEYGPRPNVTSLFERVVKVSRGDADAGGGGGGGNGNGNGDDARRIGVAACGPSSLVNACWDEASSAKHSANVFDFHYELFET